MTIEEKEVGKTPENDSTKEQKEKFLEKRTSLLAAENAVVTGLNFDHKHSKGHIACGISDDQPIIETLDEINANDLSGMHLSERVELLESKFLKREMTLLYVSTMKELNKMSAMLEILGRI